jgi:multicomponent K+:H+ antiporter subunit E/multicomponent Na+:H+ antiporter subunit E
MSRARATAVLLVRFLWQVLVSGLGTARVILVATDRLRPGLVRFPYAPMSEGGAAVLGALVTLTPGTTTVDIDPEGREMLLHLLDTSDADGTLARIRRDFERYVAVLFPPEA